MDSAPPPKTQQTLLNAAYGYALAHLLISPVVFVIALLNRMWVVAVLIAGGWLLSVAIAKQHQEARRAAR